MLAAPAHPLTCGALENCYAGLGLNSMVWIQRPSRKGSALSGCEGPHALGDEGRLTSVCLTLVSGLLQLARLLAAAAPIVLEDEGDPIAFIELADAGGFQRRGVDEYILATRLRRDEAVAFCRVEEFHGSSNAHVGRSFPGKA